MKSSIAFCAFALPLTTLLHAQMYDPFQKTHTMKTVQKSVRLLPPLPPLLGSTPMFTATVVTAVMNDKAFINDRWYKIGDSVNGQQITSIQANFVTLKEGNRLTMLGVGNQQRYLKMKEAP